MFDQLAERYKQLSQPERLSPSEERELLAISYERPELSGENRHYLPLSHEKAQELADLHFKACEASMNSTENSRYHELMDERQRKGRADFGVLNTTYRGEAMGAEGWSRQPESEEKGGQSMKFRGKIIGPEGWERQSGPAGLDVDFGWDPQ